MKSPPSTPKTTLSKGGQSLLKRFLNTQLEIPLRLFLPSEPILNSCALRWAAVYRRAYQLPVSILGIISSALPFSAINSPLHRTQGSVIVNLGRLLIPIARTVFSLRVGFALLTLCDRVRTGSFIQHKTQNSTKKSQHSTANTVLALSSLSSPFPHADFGLFATLVSGGFFRTQSGLII